MHYRQRRIQEGGRASPGKIVAPPPGKIRFLRNIHTSVKYVTFSMLHNVCYIFIILQLILAERVFLGGVHLPILFYSFFAEFCIQYLSIYFTNIQDLRVLMIA